ncbi:hypothetical protein F4801DRAFT_546263 [Xylaria longipes]|nr:hypothetical protein F4801DRAFT_546263 [Xylaria longipes]
MTRSGGDSKTGMCLPHREDLHEVGHLGGEIIGGVDGKQLTDQYLLKSSAGVDFNPGHLLKNCKEMGMNCSSLVLYHCDLGPGNILLDEGDGSIGIIDWEKGRVCSERMDSYQVSLLEWVGLIRESWGECSVCGLEMLCFLRVRENRIF